MTAEEVLQSRNNRSGDARKRLEVKADTYRVHLKATARREFKKFWSGYRLLVTMSGLLAPALFQLYRGTHTLLSVAEAMGSGAIGLFLSLLGTYLYSRRKGAEALDAEHLQRISELEKTIIELRTQLEAAKRNPGAERLYQETTLHVEKLGDVGRKVLKCLLRHDTLAFGSFNPPVQLPLPAEQFQEVLQQALKCDLVTAWDDRSIPVNPRRVYQIAPELKSFLQEILYQSAAEP